MCLYKFGQKKKGFRNKWQAWNHFICLIFISRFRSTKGIGTWITKIDIYKLNSPKKRNEREKQNKTKLTTNDTLKLGCLKMVLQWHQIDTWTIAVLNTDLDMIFLVCFGSSRTWLLGVSSSHICGCCVTPSQCSTKMGFIIFGSSSHHRVSYPTVFLFLFSIPHPLERLFPWQGTICCWYLSIFLNLGSCCYHDMDFRNLSFSFLHISRLSSCLFLSISRLYIYIFLSLTYYLESLCLHMYPPFHQPGLIS